MNKVRKNQFLTDRQTVNLMNSIQFLRNKIRRTFKTGKGKLSHLTLKDSAQLNKFLSNLDTLIDTDDLTPKYVLDRFNQLDYEIKKLIPLKLYDFLVKTNEN